MENIDVRSILELAPAYALLSLLLRVVQQLVIAPVVEGAPSVARQDEEHGRSSHRDEVEWQQQDELEDLSQGEGSIDSAGGRSAETTGRVVALGVDDP